MPLTSSDKTCTLTKGEMTVRKVYVNNQMVSVTGVGCEPKGEFLMDENSDVPQSEPFSLLMNGVLLCNDAELL
ncbi:MAG: hypothetical protein ACUVT5_03615 [Candidatus Bathyarchaeales archaeon]